MSESKLPTDRYWITLPPVELGPVVDERFRKHHEELEALGKLAVYRLARRRYEGGDHSGKSSSRSVTHGGEQGESSELTINHFGSIVTSVHAMVTQNRPAFSIAARDDSAESLASVQLVDQLLEYELSKGAEQEHVDGARRMLVFQETGLGVFWHPEAGEVVREAMPETDEMGMPVMGEDGKPRMQPEMRKGEMRTECFSPFDVARDLGARSMGDCTWHIVRRRVNKWDLAALYPEHEGEILGQPAVGRSDIETTLGASSGRAGTSGSSDTVYVLELYAMRTPAVPMGRYARVCGTTTLEAGDLQYKRLPVGLHAPERTIDEASGSSRTVDLLALQEAYDSVVSNLLSNNDAFGRGNVLYAEGQDLDVEDLGGGLQGVKYTFNEAPPPGAMSLPRLSAEDVNFAELLQNDMQKLKAISSVARGATDDAVKSGAHAALISAQAAQHNGGDQRAYAEMLRDWANRVIETYRTFATHERIIEVSGTDETRTAKSFVGSQLESVLSVDVQIANPYMRTIAGKKELADFYADPARFPNDQPMSRDQHMMFMSTGRIQPLFRSARSEAIAIREENESLMRGEQHMVAKSDHHEKHMAEHKAIYDGKRRRELPVEVIKAAMEAYDAHYAMWVKLTIEEPAILAATGQRPAPLPMMVQPPGGAPGVGPLPGGGAPANDNGQPPIAEGAQPPPEGPPNELGSPPRQPNMPVNPASGKRVAANGGPQ